MKYDYVACYEKVSGGLRAKPKLLTGIRVFNKACTLLFFAVYGAFLLYAVLDDFHPIDLMKIIGAPALCLLVVTVLRHAINRPRPYSEQGAKIVPLHEKKTQDKSFPSRHSASAFVIAVTLLPYAVWLGVPLLFLGSLLAFTRFALGLHYPSDLVAGAGIGILCGLVGIFLF